MVTVYKELEEFLLDNILDKSELIKSFNNFKIHYIMHNKIKEIDKLEYQNVIIKMRKQKELYEAIEDEIILLSDIFEKKGIRFICLKGFFLAKDIYNPIEVRKSNDIDILVGIQDLEKALTVLKDLSYTNLDSVPITDDLFKIELTSLLKRFIHLPQLKKNKYWRNKEVSIRIDLHFNLYKEIGYNNDIIEGIFNRAILKKYKNHKIWLLELQDRLIHLAEHFTKEYIKNDIFYMLIKFNNKKLAYPRLNLIHDMALLIEKNYSILQWDVLLKRSIDLDICSRILIPFKFIDTIYPNLIPSSVLIKLSENINPSESFIGEIISFLLESDFKKIIFYEPDKLIEDIFNKIEFLGPKIRCYPRIRDNIQASVYFIKQFSCLNINLLRAAEIVLDPASNHSAQGRFSYDAINLYLDLCVNENEKCNDVNIIKKLPFFVLRFAENRKNPYGCYILRFVFYPIQDGNKLRIKYDNNEVDYPYEFELEFNENGYKILVTIPWSFLNIIPNKGKKILFNIELFYYLINRDTSKYEIEWIFTKNKYTNFTDSLLLSSLSTLILE